MSSSSASLPTPEGPARAIEIPGASHAIAVSNAEATADLILQAATLPAAA